MIFETCGIPRLVKIAAVQWHAGMVNGATPSTWMENFFLSCRSYYGNVELQLPNFESRDLAMLFLCCNCQISLLPDSIIPGTTLLVRDLVDSAMIFPSSRKLNYTTPPMFWPTAVHNNGSPKWAEVLTAISAFVPGLNMRHLLISNQAWTKALTSKSPLKQLGCLWENLVASALVVKYKLTSLVAARPQVPFSSVYEIGDNGQAAELLRNLNVNWSSGIKRPSKQEGEATTENIQQHCVAVNSTFPTAHHDIVCSVIPDPSSAYLDAVAVQCKNSLSKPGGKAVADQLKK